MFSGRSGIASFQGDGAIDPFAFPPGPALSPAHQSVWQADTSLLRTVLQVRLTDLDRSAVRPFSLHSGKVRTVVPVDTRMLPLLAMLHMAHMISQDT